MIKNVFLLSIAFGIIFSSCYKFKNVAISSEVNKYYVYEFKSSARNVDANFAFRLQEDIKARIRQETRLKYDDLDPDIEIKANLTKYDIDISNLSAGNVATENEVLATFKVEYINNKNIEENWEESFQERTTYSTDLDYLDIETTIQDDLIEKLSARIFNKLFNNW